MKNKAKRRKFTSGNLKYIFNISLVAVVTVVSLVIALWGEKFNRVGEIFEKGNYVYLLTIVAFIVVEVLIACLIYYCFARLFIEKYSFIDAFGVEEIGKFYHSVTRGSSSANLAQINTYHKQGIPISCAVSIVLMYSIVSQFVLLVYGVVSFIVKYNFINEIGTLTIALGKFSLSIPLGLVTIIAFVIKVCSILLILVLSFWKRFHGFFLGPVLNFLARIRLVKDKEETRSKYTLIVEDFKVELRRLLKNIPFLILVTILVFGLYTIQFGIPYFVGIVLNNQSTNASFFDSVFLSNYHSMIVGVIPIPGGVGVSEYFFAKLFCGSSDGVMGFYALKDAAGQVSYTLSSSLTSACLLLWRTSTFTIPIIISGIITGFYHASPTEEFKASEHFPTRENFLLLKKETYLERFSTTSNILLQDNSSKEEMLKSLGIQNDVKEDKASGKDDNKDS